MSYLRRARHNLSDPLRVQLGNSDEKVASNPDIVHRRLEVLQLKPPQHRRQRQIQLGVCQT